MRVRRNWGDTLYSSIPDAYKDQAWQDMHRLTQDDDRDVRVSSNYSLGRVSILKATDTTNENKFKNELKNALEFFEKSNAEAILINPAKFCHSFYKSIFSITFEERNVEVKVQEYIKEAKNAVEGSESKKTLLEAVENLENALREVHKSREKGLDAWKHDLKTYKQYCDRACNLLDITEKDAPGATNIIRRGLPIIDQQIKEILNKIDKDAKILCDIARGTEAEKYTNPTCEEVRQLTKIRNPIELGKRLTGFIPNLRFLAENLSEKDRPFIYTKVEIFEKEEYLEDKLNILNEIIIFVTPHIKMSEILENLLSKLNEITVSLDSGISEEFVITVGAGFWGTGAQHIITIPLQKISYSDLEKDLKSIKNERIFKLTSLPSRLADKVKDYLIQNEKDELLKRLE